MSTDTLTVANVRPARFPEERFHYVPELGRTDYGDPAETLGAVNQAQVLRELDALGVEAFLSRERTWLCGVVAFVVDAYHPATMPYLSALADRLETYPCLNDEALSEAEWAEGYCQACGSRGLPEGYGEGDTCEHCGYEPMA